MGAMIYILLDYEVDLPIFRIIWQPLSKAQQSESNGILYDILYPI